MKAFLESVDVRLVFVVHREPRSERLTKPASVIGRRTKDGVDIALGDVSVSKLHAKISLTQNTFRVEDLESSNGVSIAGSRLASGGESRTAESDTCISFGAVDAFLVIPPRVGATDEIKDQAKVYREALKRLSTDAPSATAIGAAEGLGSGAHPGEHHPVRRHHRRPVDRRGEEGPHLDRSSTHPLQFLRRCPRGRAHPDRRRRRGCLLLPDAERLEWRREQDFERRAAALLALPLSNVAAALMTGPVERRTRPRLRRLSLPA